MYAVFFVKMMCQRQFATPLQLHLRVFFLNVLIIEYFPQPKYTENSGIYPCLGKEIQCVAVYIANINVKCTLLTSFRKAYVCAYVHSVLWTFFESFYLIYGKK